MDLSEENLKTLAGYLTQTLSPDNLTRKNAEKFLESVEINKGYPVLLLSLVMKNEIEAQIRIAGAISFKNYIKRNWPIIEGENKMDPGDRAAVKEAIVDAMLSSPGPVQKQLSEAVGVIGSCDFPRDWPNLLPSMVLRFAGGDFHVINGALQTCHSIFKRYRHEFKSQELWEEIKFVLDTFAKPLTELATATQNLTVQYANNPDALRTIYSSLLLICKIFNSLNSQDLPEFFEDHMNVWMPLFHQLLISEVKCLETEDDNESGLMEQLKSQICANICLYTQKYDEEFAPYLPGFVTDVWNLLVSISLQPKNDILVSNALGFLSAVGDRKQHRHLFQDPAVLAGICEKVIIPNIHLRDSDIELFEDNPEEWIRRDMEGSDIESRRRAASDFLRVLSQEFPGEIQSTFGSAVQRMLADYQADPNSNWRLKNTAIYIVTSLSERGSTVKHGVTKTSNLVVLEEFATNFIVPELNKDLNLLPVIKSDCIKFFITFRSVLPPNLLLNSFPMITKFLHSPIIVVHTYASLALEKLLIVRSNNEIVIKKNILDSMANEILVGLFKIFEIRGSEFNDYAMKCVMRVFNTMGESIIPYLSNYLPKLTEKLSEIAKNPTKPLFNHYLFESLSISIKIVCGKNSEAVGAFENALFPIFQGIFQNDVEEFAPYCMQVLSLMLGTRTPGSGLPGPYLALYPSLLTPALWERSGTIRGLVSLLESYVIVSTPQDYVNTLSLTGLLGIFQKLISSRLNDHEGFRLMHSLVIYAPQELLAPYMKQICLLLFQRLTSSKTAKFVKCLIVFFNLIIVKYSALTFIDLVDSVQAQMFPMVVERLFVADARKITDNIEKKIVAVGLSRLLSETKQIFGGPYSNTWSPIARTLVEILEAPSEEDPNSTEVEVEDISGYDAAYVSLSAIGNANKDPIPEIVNPRDELATHLKILYSNSPQNLSTIVNSLGDPYTSALKQYLLRAGVHL